MGGPSGQQRVVIQKQIIARHEAHPVSVVGWAPVIAVVLAAVLASLGWYFRRFFGSAVRRRFGGRD